MKWIKTIRSLSETKVRTFCAQVVSLVNLFIILIVLFPFFSVCVKAIPSHLSPTLNSGPLVLSTGRPRLAEAKYHTSFLCS
jgi:hypothetical protein